MKNRFATSQPGGWALSLVALWFGLVLAYMLSAPPDIAFEDTAMFSGACATLGLPHPPGYPLYVWSCFPVSWLAGVLGLSYVLGAAMWSAFTTAAACVVLAMLIRRVAGVPAVALFAAGLFGLAPSVWDQAQIPEVYGLNLLLLMTCWYLCQRFVEQGERRWLYALACCTGLGLAAHWPLFVLSYPLLLLWLAQAWPRLFELARDKRVVVCCLAFFVAGLLPYAHLLLVDKEAYVHSEFHTSSLLAYVSRDLYSSGRVHLPPMSQLGTAATTFTWFMREYLYLFGLAVPVGLFVLWKRREHWQLASIVCGMLMTTFVLYLVQPYDPNLRLAEWVFHAYPLPAYAVAALPLALGLGYALSMTRKSKGNAAIAAIALVGVAFWRFPEVDRSGGGIAAEYSRLVLQHAPQDALILNYEESYRIDKNYVRPLDDPRPDLDIVKEDDYLESVQGGFASADDEKKLLAEERPVVFLYKLESNELSMSYHGTHFLLDKEGLPGTMSVDLNDDARDFLTHLYELRKQGVRNAFTSEFVQIAITNFVTVLETARLRGERLDMEDLRLLKLLEDTPDGKFAKFLAFVLDSPQKPSVAEVERQAAQLQQHWDSLQEQQRSDVLHLLATVRFFGNDIVGALDALRLAFKEYPSALNNHVLIDLLQVLATQGHFEEYERLRKRHRALSAGNVLAAYDAKCKDALLRDCTFSLQ